MEKIGRLVLAIVRARQGSAKKTYERCLLLLSCSVAVMAGLAPQVMAATEKEKCEKALADGGCIVINTVSFLSFDYSVNPFPGASIIGATTLVSGMDHTCAPQTISVQPISTSPGEKYFNVGSHKYYYDPIGKAWVQLAGSAGGLYWATEAQNSQWKSTADYVMTSYSTFPVFYTTPWVMYPNGCSDLPSPQPDQSPNIDTGNPGCNDRGL